MNIGQSVTTPRLRIRSYTEADLDFVSAIWFDDENGRYLSDPPRALLDEVYRNALAGLAESPLGYYLIAELTTSGERIGTCSIFPNDDGTVCDIAYCVDKRHWRQGYGREIVTVLETFCRALGAKRITAEVAQANRASNCLLSELGYTIEKEAEFAKYKTGIVYPSYIYHKSATAP